MKAAIIGLTAILSGGVHAGNAPQPPGAEAVVRAEMIDARAPYPQAHASTIVQLADGSLMTAWFAGSGEGNIDVRIWTSHSGGQKGDGWSAPEPVAAGVGPDGHSLPTWNPVLFQPAPGDLRLFYKVGPNPRDWWGMMLRSTDNGRSWSMPERLPDGVLGPIKNKPVVLRDGSWLAPSSREEGTAETNRWSLRMERSTDRGAHWMVEPPIASPMHIQAIQPSILSYPDGRLELVARTRQGALAMSWSKDTGRTWSPLAAIDLPNPNAGTDAVTLRDGRQLIVYNHSGHWPDRPGGGPRRPLNLAVSDDGVRWHPVLTLESKPLPDGYAYPAVIQTRDGLVRITYTYDRKHIKYVVVDPRRLH